MRILVRNSNDNELLVAEIDSAFVTDSITVENYGVGDEYSCGCALEMTLPERSNSIYVIMPRADCECYINKLLVDGYADLEEYVDATFIFPDERDIEHLRKFCVEENNNA